MKPSVAKYMARIRRPPSQGWKTFLCNHADAIASMDMFVVPTVSFRLLYGLLILRHARRELLWLGVTAHPNAEWIAQQLTEAFGWKEVPRYLMRDRDGAYGEAFVRRVSAMGIRDHSTSARSPWENGHAERLIGSIRRDCLDHVVVLGERHPAVCPTLMPSFSNSPWIRGAPQSGLARLIRGSNGGFQWTLSAGHIGNVTSSANRRENRSDASGSRFQAARSSARPEHWAPTYRVLQTRADQGTGKPRVSAHHVAGY